MILLTASWKVLDLGVLAVSCEDLIRSEDLVANSNRGSWWHHRLVAGSRSGSFAQQTLDGGQELQHLLLVAYFHPFAF